MNIQLPDIPASVSALVARAEADCQPAFARVEEIERLNTRRVVRAFQEHRVAARHFAPTTGYGYDDIGRDTLSRLFSFVFETEDALVRPQIASGTHALALCLYGILRPGDEMLAAAENPTTRWKRSSAWPEKRGTVLCGTLALVTAKCPWRADGGIDVEGVLAQLAPAVKLVLIQRSLARLRLAALAVRWTDQ